MLFEIAAVLLHRIDIDQLLGIERADDPEAQDWVTLTLTDDDLAAFLGHPPDPTGEILNDVAVIGDPTTTQSLQLDRVEGDWRLIHQSRQTTPGRHPAWTEERGFPSGPENLDRSGRHLLPDPSMTLLVLVRTVSGDIYASFDGPAAGWESWPSVLRLAPTTTALTRVIVDLDDSDAMLEHVTRALDRSPNVLLYGPPGTGKTRLLRQLWERVSGDRGPIRLDPDATAAVPFPRETTPDPTTINAWTTFHQSTTYEDVVLGRRPESGQLVAYAGVLLDLAARIDRDVVPSGEATRAFLFVDEINRANVSRALGEFITFMDREYRKGEHQLPVPLGRIGREGDCTKEVELADGSKVAFPVPWYFPQDFYVIASMNSVDRAVAPLDSALARRFEKIELAPDLELLATALGLDPSAVDERLGTAPEELTIREIAWLIIRRINSYLAATFGRDFELGHAYLLGVARGAPENQLGALAAAWDGKIYPQLADRLVARPEDLASLLRVDGADEEHLYEREADVPGLELDEETALKRVSLVDVLATGDAGILRVEHTLRRLAGADS